MPVAQIITAKKTVASGSEFINNRDQLNRLGEKSKGFIWHLIVDHAINHEIIQLDDDAYTPVNLSVWDTIDDLYDYVYKTTHGEMLLRKADWLAKMQQMRTAIWYVAPDHLPSIKEACERMAMLQKEGETPLAFTFKKRFSEEDSLNYVSVVT